MCKAGIKIIQYREKHKSIKEKLIECREIRKITKDYGVIFIVNDHLEIAMLSDACGLHLGQDDLDICDARKLIPNMIIGKSTHSISDAEKAVIDGADYIGVGPIYKTNTKDREPVGLEYLSYAVKNIKIPFIAIGGIKEHNLEEIVSYGAERISLVSDIVESKNIVEKINSLKNIIMKGN